MKVLKAVILIAACAGAFAFNLPEDLLSMEIADITEAESESEIAERDTEVFIENELGAGHCWCEKHWCQCLADTGAKGVSVNFYIEHNEMCEHCCCSAEVTITLQDRAQKHDRMKEKEWEVKVDKMVDLSMTYMGAEFSYDVEVDGGCCCKKGFLRGKILQVKPNRRRIGTFHLPLMEENGTEEEIEN